MKHTFICECCNKQHDTVLEAELCELSHRPDDKKSFGYRLAKMRVSRGLSQANLSKLTTINEQQLWKYEYNKVNPSMSSLKLLCKALDTTASNLLGF